MKCSHQGCRKDAVVQWQKQAGRDRVAVFACTAHAVDVDKATHLHEAGCKVGDCACDTTPPKAVKTSPHPKVDAALKAKGWA